MNLTPLLLLAWYQIHFPIFIRLAAVFAPFFSSSSLFSSEKPTHILHGKHLNQNSSQIFHVKKL
jgi:hypothetical protein